MAEEPANENGSWGGGDDIFVYMGGEQVSRNVRRVRIHPSVMNIPRMAFYRRGRLEYVEFHDGVERVESGAFEYCVSLNWIKMLGVREVEYKAFLGCEQLTDVQMPAIERIGERAFAWCPLRSITMPSVQVVGVEAFHRCEQLMEAIFGAGLNEMKSGVFYHCTSLRRIAIPLKEDLVIDKYAFYVCPSLRVDIDEGIRRTISSLHMEGWRNEMEAEINRINQILPTTTHGETGTIQQWIESAYHMMERYTAQHEALLEETATLLLDLGLSDLIAENVISFLALSD